MAKRNGRKSNGRSGELVSPLYGRGRETNAPVGGPKGGMRPRDPFGYVTRGEPTPAPRGRAGDRSASAHAEREMAH